MIRQWLSVKILREEFFLPVYWNASPETQYAGERLCRTGITMRGLIPRHKQEEPYEAHFCLHGNHVCIDIL